MSRTTPRILIFVSLALGGLVGLVLVNYSIALQLLRLEESEEMFARLSSSMEPVKRPLAFSVVGMEPEHPAVGRFSESLGLRDSERRDLPAAHPLSIDLQWILDANPYPPILHELRGVASTTPHLSFGYLGTDGDFHQVTFFGGEADTTPSILTPKVRREHTGHGDFFVRYIFHLRRPTVGAVAEASSSVDIMGIDWSSYAGGSYSGLEEIELTMLATTVETVLLIVAISTIWWIRRRTSLASDAARIPDG